MYEKETIDFLIKNIQTNKIFLDLGANMGSICLPICKVRKDIKAICVEAAPWIFELLETNVQRNSIANALFLFSQT